MAYVYVFDFGDMVKVGYTSDLKTRQITIQSNLKKKAVNVFSVPGSRADEALAHEKLEPFRIRGEFYDCDFSKACAVVEAATNEPANQQEEVETAKFTMVMDEKLARQMTYIAKYYGRSRIKEIDWACRQYVKEFEEKVGKIEFEEQ